MINFYDPSSSGENPTVYILVDGNTSNVPIEIKDEYGYTPWIFTDYTYDDYVSTYKAYAVESSTYIDSSGNSVDGFLLAIKK